jgi:hypothetical protein
MNYAAYPPRNPQFSFLGEEVSCDMKLGSIDDALMMREDFEILAARDRDKRDAAGVRQAHASRCRDRHGGDNRRAETRRFLNKFDRNPACEKYDAMRGRLPAPRERADELVERIVATDILPHGDKATRRAPKARGMNGVGLAHRDPRR